MNNIDILEEKEKEAIKDLEEYLHWEELQGFSMLPRDKHIETLLNLVSTLIAENKELKEENKKMEELIENSECDMSTNYIRKSKVEEIIEELRNDTCKIINRTYIPTISSKLFNNNREKYEPMLEARNILINALNKLQSILGKE